MTETESAWNDGRPEGVTCEMYLRGEGKRCRHYLPHGACSLPGELMCVEWLKKNAPRPRAGRAGERSKDLFGNPSPEPPVQMQTPVQSPPPAASLGAVGPQPPTEETAPVLRGLTTEDIEGFKDLRVEVCVRAGDHGEFWIVPVQTGRSRREVTPEHLATIARVLDVFSNSEIVAFDWKQPPTTPEGVSA